jgi:hypothetical protein
MSFRVISERTLILPMNCTEHLLESTCLSSPVCSWFTLILFTNPSKDVSAAFVTFYSIVLLDSFNAVSISIVSDTFLLRFKHNKYVLTLLHIHLLLKSPIGKIYHIHQMPLRLSRGIEKSHL